MDLLIRQVADVFCCNVLLDVGLQFGGDLGGGDEFLHVVLCVFHAEQVEKFVELGFPGCAQAVLAFQKVKLPDNLP